MSGTDLEGRTAVVAGVSQGAGLATARRLGSAGARVVGIARTPPEAADPLFVRADLSTRSGLRSGDLVEEVCYAGPRDTGRSDRWRTLVAWLVDPEGGGALG